MRIGLAALSLMLLAHMAVGKDAVDTVPFKIEAQSLGAALNEFARQSGMQLLVNAADVPAGRMAPAVIGELAPEEALKKLLADSGLEYKFVNARTVAVRPPQPSGAGVAMPAVFPSAAEGTRPDLVLAQTPVDSVTAQRSDRGGPLTGRVSEAEAHAPVAGALVRIQENGQVTTTDSLGRFRFADLPPGEYTLSISYLGYAERLWRVTPDANGSSSQEYNLDKATWNIAEVTVFGTRSSRSAALNQQRTAEDSSFVISADALGDFPGTTISEALRRAPGVAFQRDPVNGDGTNVILRGLAPEMNAIMLNGLIVPSGDVGSRRAATINNLLADSVDTITIHHTLLPSMSSMGSGGLIEIETKSPLRRARRYANFGVEYGRSGGNFSDDLLATGTVSGSFGENDNFGLSASLQYRKRKIQNISYNTLLSFGRYLPLASDGSLGIFTIDQIDPRDPFPFEPGNDEAFPNFGSSNFNDSDNDTLDATVSGEWRIADHTNLRLDVQRARTRSETFARQSSSIFPAGYNKVMAAPSLGGELRNALIWDNPDVPFFDGSAVVSQTYARTSSDDTSDSYSFRGSSTAGKWQHNYAMGYARASAAPDTAVLTASFSAGIFGSFVSLDPSMLRPEVYDAQGNAVSAYGPRSGRGLPLPLFSEAGWAFFNSPDSYNMLPGSLTHEEGRNARYTGELSTRYEFGGAHFQYLEVGANFESSRFSAHRDQRSVTFCPPEGCGSFSPVPLSSFGLDFHGSNLDPIGVRGRSFELISQHDIEGFVEGLPALARSEPDRIRLEDVLLDDALNNNSTRENNLAAYVQGSLRLGRLEIVGGARLDRVGVKAVNLYGPTFIPATGIPDLAFTTRYTQLVDQSGTTTDILPRVQFNYRLSDDLIFRASYNLAVARPSVSELSAQPRLNLDLTTGFFKPRPTLDIVRGNPSLDPAVTHSFDLGVEYYDRQIGLMRLNAFYKQIEHLLETEIETVARIPGDVELPDDPDFQAGLAADDLLITATRPVNTPYAGRIWGLEAHVERQFVSLPGIWGGLGMFTNLTYTDSAHVQSYFWFFGPTGNQQLHIRSVPLLEQPKLSGTFALTYNAHQIDSSLSYTGQSRKTSMFYANGLGFQDETYDSVDLRVEYALRMWGGKYRVYFEGSDLLKGTQDPDLMQTQAGFFTSGSFLGGRRLKLGFNATF